MSQYKKISYLAAAIAVLFVFHFSAQAQTVNNLTLEQPPAVPSDIAEPEAQTPQQPVGAPTPLTHKHTATHKPVKHKAKKTKHKTTAHKKTSKKTAAHKTAKAKKTAHKKKPAPKSPAKETHREAPKPAVAAVALPVKKSAPDTSMAVVQKERVAPPPSHTALSGQAKTVAYNFCLGYDNCVPHRYEASIQNGKAYGAIVMQKDENGKWTEGKLDGAMMADLDRMAQAETQTNVERDLTPEEKSEIAGHQGKMHAMLVSYIQAGVEKKEEIKNMLRQLKIHTLADLEAYDPRLAKHDVAVQAVSENSVAR